MADKSLDDMTEEELALNYEDHKDDISLWAKKPMSIRLRRGQGPSTILSLRLTGEELTAIARAAQASGVTTSEYIRRATMAKVGRHSEPPNPQALDEVRAKLRDLSETIERLAQA